MDPPVIDGIPDEDAWQAAAVISDFVQNEPFEGRAATERTEVRILYDDAAVYVAAWMFDADPSAIVLGETRRDADLSDTDALLIVLDTYLDRQNGFVFGTTPAGIEYDGQVIKEGQGGFGGGFGSGGSRQQRGSGGGFNVNWDGSWDVATSRDGRGWYAEFRIPFSTLRYGRGGAQTWGLNISRNIRRRNEQAFWAPIPRQFDLYRLSQAGTLQGIEAPARRTVDVTPYVLGSSEWDYTTGAGGPAVNRVGDIGGDIKIGVTPSLTFDATYNTDFAQVEVDDEQINLTRFSLFFPEKRPFFLENAGTFSVGTPRSVELFFSRRIGIADGLAVPILGGGRLTGKVGRVTVGALNIQTRRLQRLDPATRQLEEIAPRNNFSVARVLRELPNRSRIGAMFISRLNTDDTNDYNLTYVVDGRLGIGDAVSIDGYVALTQTPGLVDGEHAFNISGSYTTRNWEAGLAFRELGADFNPEVGFLGRRAYRFRSARLLRHVRFPSIPWFRELRPHITYREFLDLDGFSETRLIHIDNHLEFANGAFFQFPSVNFTREGIKEPFGIADGVEVLPGTYNNIDIGWRFNTNESATLSLAGSTNIGGFYSGHRKGGDITLNGRFGYAFVMGLRLGYFDVDLAEGSFETALIALRTAYSFTPRIYLQSLIQYSDQTDNFSVNVRFGWLNTAGTGLFVVYNDIERVESESRWEAVNRSFIVKFTQLFHVAR
ncbi:MAG: carbohydrate binding family 9 domain-containing protein [Gemmatimonadetes bacterium]|nr:carbohydrate binding family 9 domain-containing protein [Gemmatimonadota bacterium]